MPDLNFIFIAVDHYETAKLANQANVWFGQIAVF